LQERNICLLDLFPSAEWKAFGAKLNALTKGAKTAFLSALLFSNVNGVSLAGRHAISWV